VRRENMTQTLTQTQRDDIYLTFETNARYEDLLK
jgi:hypothetical protein